MTIWLGAQLSPLLAAWLNWKFDVQAIPVRDLGLRAADHEDIFRAAKQAGVVILTKDADFPRLPDRFGPPPQVLWPTSGNTSNERLQQVLLPVLPAPAKQKLSLKTPCNKYCCRCYPPR